MKAICKIENSEYSKKLREIENLEFNNIIQISKEYVANHIEDEKKIHDSLNRGTKVLEEEEELYQYMKSFSTSHQEKLEYSFFELFKKNNKVTMNIIDWGCGQAFATCVLMDYIKYYELKFTISDVILIEPSEPALNRALLHVDVLKENEINIKAINKDLDNLKESDLVFKNNNTTLHLFSNILDIESFNLDKLLKNISTSQSDLNYFICISPNIDIAHNSRLDRFYNYFRERFNAKLISKRNSDIDIYSNGRAITRYEIIFKAKI
jgi:hypothetical protein